MQLKLTNGIKKKKRQIIIWIKDQREEINSSYFETWNSSITQISQLKLQQDIIQKESEVAQSCPTLWDPVDCSPPGSSIHGILQARILEWVAISFSRGSSWPRDWTQVSCIAGRRFNLWATREAPIIQRNVLMKEKNVMLQPEEKNKANNKIILKFHVSHEGNDQLQMWAEDILDRSSPQRSDFTWIEGFCSDLSWK